ncbi:MAG: hypothetical protein LBI69_05170 [Puniceicoccales bacterium]|nr:hypothetical protein [Puniceicoccales bacterium]
MNGATTAKFKVPLSFTLKLDQKTKNIIESLNENLQKLRRILLKTLSANEKISGTNQQIANETLEVESVYCNIEIARLILGKSTEELEDELEKLINKKQKILTSIKETINDIYNIVVPTKLDQDKVKKIQSMLERINRNDIYHDRAREENKMNKAHMWPIDQWNNMQQQEKEQLLAKERNVHIVNKIHFDLQKKVLNADKPVWELQAETIEQMKKNIDAAEKEAVRIYKKTEDLNANLGPQTENEFQKKMEEIEENLKRVQEQLNRENTKVKRIQKKPAKEAALLTAWLTEINYNPETALVNIEKNIENQLNTIISTHKNASADLHSNCTRMEAEITSLVSQIETAITSENEQASELQSKLRQLKQSGKKPQQEVKKLTEWQQSIVEIQKETRRIQNEIEELRKQ